MSVIHTGPQTCKNSFRRLNQCGSTNSAVWDHRPTTEIFWTCIKYEYLPVDFSVEVHWMVRIMTLQTDHAAYWCYLLVPVFNFLTLTSGQIPSNVWMKQLTGNVVEKVVVFWFDVQSQGLLGMAEKGHVRTHSVWDRLPGGYVSNSLHDLPLAKTVTYLALLPTFVHTDWLEVWRGT